MDLMDISKNLQDTILDIAISKGKLRGAYNTKSVAEANLAKVKACLAMGLRNGKQYELDDGMIINPPVTLMPDLIKGLCWKEALERDKAEGEVRALEQELRALQSMLNGYQTIHKHLD